MDALRELLKHTAEAKKASEVLSARILTGELCPSCIESDCPRDIMDRPIRVSVCVVIKFNGCSKAAEIRQQKQDALNRETAEQSKESIRLLAVIPARFAEAGFAEFKVTGENTAAYHSAKEFAVRTRGRQPGRSLLIVGPTGVGKTHLGCAILNVAVESVLSCRYFYAPDMLEMLRGKSRDETMTRLAYRAICEYPLAVIDEVGMDTDTAWTVGVYTRIIDERYRAKLPTVITSNLSMPQLNAAVGERAMSRIVETYDVLGCNGDDYRWRNK